MTFSANAADWFISGGFQGWAHANANYQFKPVEGKEGVYSFETEKLYGEFIIYGGTVGAPDWNSQIGPKDNKKVIPNELYTYGPKGNFNLEGEVENAVITLDTNNQTLLVAGKSAANDYDTVYLVGDFGSGWSENTTDHPLTLKQGSDNVWEGEYTLTAATSYFKMKAGVNIYGTGQGNVDIELGKEYTASQSGEAFSIPAGKYTFSFVLDKNAETGVLTVTGEEAVIPLTPVEELYMLGETAEVGGFNHNTALLGQTVDPEKGIYTFTNVLLMKSEGNNFVSFTSKLSGTDDNSGWDAISDCRYGAPSKDYPVEIGTPAGIQKGENAYAVAGNGPYDITVNFENRTVVFAKAALLTPEVKVTQNYTAPTNYTNVVTSEAGHGAANIVQVNNTVEDATYTLHFSVAEPQNASSALEEKVVADPYSFAVEKSKEVLGGYVYSVKAVASRDGEEKESESALFLVQPGITVTPAEGKGEKNVVISIATDSPATLFVNGAAVEGKRYEGKLADGQQIFFNCAYGDLKSPVTTYINNGTTVSVEGIEVAEGEAQYFNLQGVKVLNPENGLYIKVVDGKATKVVIRR